MHGACNTITLIIYVHVLYHIVLFTHIAKPDITEISPDYMVMSRNTAIFHCKATGKPRATIHWLKDGLSFDDSERTDITITYFSTGSSCNDTDPADQCVNSSTVQIATHYYI